MWMIPLAAGRSSWMTVYSLWGLSNRMNLYRHRLIPQHISVSIISIIIETIWLFQGMRNQVEAQFSCMLHDFKQVIGGNAHYRNFRQKASSQEQFSSIQRSSRLFGSSRWNLILSSCICNGSGTAQLSVELPKLLRTYLDILNTYTTYTYLLTN